MKIQSIQTNQKIYNSTKKVRVQKQQMSFDSFVPSFGANETKKKHFFDFFKKVNQTEEPNFQDDTVDDLYKEFSIALKNKYNSDIPPQNFKNIVLPNETQEILSSISRENFCYKNRTEMQPYCIDLDCQSNFSTGKESINEILKKVASVAESYYHKTGKDFVFALTDLNSIAGVQHVVRTLGQYPELYQHVKFIPAIKINFEHKKDLNKLFVHDIEQESNDDYETSEMLIYGINPFSENIENFVNRKILERQLLCFNMINDANELYPEFGYDFEEFTNENHLSYFRDYTISNLYEKVKEYILTKGDVTIKNENFKKEEIAQEVEDILNNLGRIYGSDTDTEFSQNSANSKNEKYLNPEIVKIFDKYSKHPKVYKHSDKKYYENLYEEMIECFQKEKEKPYMAISAPYNLLKIFKNKDDAVTFINELKTHSDGMLQAFETVCPEYKKESDYNPFEIEKFNDFLAEKLNMNEVGSSLDEITSY